MRRYTLYIKYISRLMALALVLTMLFGAIPAASAETLTGSCGNGLKWTFADGTLTITGSGDMTDFASVESVPWYPVRDQILRLELPQGLTRVGNKAFRDCTKLTAVTIPSTVTDIGEQAFYQCSSLAILKLNEGLKTIGKSAFKECVMLQDLRLSETVTSLGRHTFYGCDGLRYLTIPASVTELGSGVFAYCRGLIRADVLAPMEELPSWIFYGCESLISISLAAQTQTIGTYGVYGCENLSVIYYGGEAGDAEELRQQVSEDLEGFAQFGTISEDENGDNETLYEYETSEEGDVIAENTTVVQTEDATVITTTTENLTDPDKDTGPTEVTATIVDEEGWEEVLEAVENAMESGEVEVTVYVSGEANIPQTVADALAGKNVTMKVLNGTDTSCVLDFRLVQQQEQEKKEEIQPLILSYQLNRLETTDHADLQGCPVFQMLFNSSATVPVQLLVQLPVEVAGDIATLYQVEKDGTLTLLQSTVTDTKAAAHFYVRSLDNETEYLIGINVPSAAGSGAIIPDELANAYGVNDNSGIEYVITGTKSSWNMNIGQVTWILAGVMFASVVAVGAVMFALNKRRLRQGYVPEWDDDEE